MLRMSCKVISIIGTTGVGKSQFAVELARAVDGEIVNADSMQMYRGLDQITNKHPVAERKGVPHHVMDHTPWDTEYYIHRFKQEAMAAIADIHSRGKTAILVGGTHYYLQSLLFLNKTLDTATAEQLTDAERAVLDGQPDEVFRTLQQKDPVVAQKFHPNDHRRVRRALEIYFATKQRTSDLYRSQQQQAVSALRYQMLFFWLYARQDVLDERLDSRVDKMLQQGALAEIREMHAFRSRTEPTMELHRGVWQVIGYKEFLPYLEEGPERLAGCIEDMKRNTRRGTHGARDAGRRAGAPRGRRKRRDKVAAPLLRDVCGRNGTTDAFCRRAVRSASEKQTAPEQREKKPPQAGAHIVTRVLGLFNRLLLLGRAFLDAAVVVLDHVLLDELGRGVEVVWLLRQEQVEDDADEAGDGEAGLHDENYGVEEAGKPGVVAVVREDVAEPVGEQRGAEAEHERAREHEAISSGEGRGGDDLEPGHGHGREQERGHAAEHGFRNGDERGGEFREHAHHNEEKAAPVPNSPGGALGDGDDAVVLRKSRHWRHGHERGDDAVDSVREHTALDARLVVGALDVGAGHVAGGGDVADGLHHEHDVAREEGQHGRAVHGQLERVHPHEGCCRGGVDRVVRKVAARGGDYAADQEPDNHGAGLHDGRPPLLAQDDGEVHQEPEPEELRRPPVVALGTAVGGVHAPGAPHKVLKSGLDQRHANEQHHRARHDGRKNALQQRRRQKREQHLQQTAHGRRSENGAVSVGTWQLRPVAVHGANACVIHDWKSLADNADGGE
ncbi:hypothetical protein KL920_003491 [Ogataea angusta]|nr:hypothetical protein KL920_003491 [Ogataea angusta]